MRLTKNFMMYEFDCNDGTKVPKKYYDNVKELAERLQIIRDYYNIIFNLGKKKPVEYYAKIISGYRTLNYNQEVGGVRNSRHLIAEAGDLKIYRLKKRILRKAKKIYQDPKFTHALIEFLIKEEKISDGGLGLYISFIHLDTRKKGTRWNLT